jgi:cell division protein FtsB
MVTRKRLRTILNALGLYVLAALLIGYFGVNAYSGDRGLKAKEDIDRQMASLNADLTRLKLEHAQWARRVALLKSDAIDPDMLDERARTLLDYVDPNDMTMMFQPVPSQLPSQASSQMPSQVPNQSPSPAAAPHS